MPSSNTSRSPVNITGQRPTWAEIDLSALAANFQIVRQRVSAEVKVMGVVKADAYGHGAVECARRLAKENPDWFGVALPEEGIALRRAGITQPILCLSGFWEGQQDACIQQRLVPVAYRMDMIEALDRAAAAAGVMADVHVKVDSGMGRLGIRFDQLSEFAAGLSRLKHIRVDGLMTHFAAADDPSCEPLTGNQLRRFNDALETFRAAGHNPTYRHLANSAAIFAEPASWGNMVRPGGVLYGLWRDVLRPVRTGSGNDLIGDTLRPVMSLRSHITLLKLVPQGETIGYGCTYEASRPTLVATLPLGYNDGYLRALSNRGRVIVRDAYAEVIGRVSMDLTLVDVTDVPGVMLGDEVTLFGVAGDRAVSAEDAARTAGTISYELTCGISERVPRIYLSS
jgi:alanine racemase